MHSHRITAIHLSSKHQLCLFIHMHTLTRSHTIKHNPYWYNYIHPFYGFIQIEWIPYHRGEALFWNCIAYHTQRNINTSYPTHSPIRQADGLLVQRKTQYSPVDLNENNQIKISFYECGICNYWTYSIICSIHYTYCIEIERWPHMQWPTACDLFSTTKLITTTTKI